MQSFIFYLAVAHREEAVNQHVPKHPFARDERAETLPAEPNFSPSLTAPLSPYPAPAKSPSLRPPALPRQHSCRSTRRWKGKTSGPSREEGRWPRGSWHRGLRRLGSAAATGSRGAGKDPGAGPGRPCPHCCPRVPQGQSQGLDLHLPSGQPRGSGLSHALEPGAQPR